MAFTINDLLTHLENFSLRNPDQVGLAQRLRNIQIAYTEALTRLKATAESSMSINASTDWVCSPLTPSDSTISAAEEIEDVVDEVVSLFLEDGWSVEGIYDNDAGNLIGVTIN